MDDDALMRRAADGDTQAFSQVVHAYQGRLVRFAARLLNDSDAAQDAAQEAFLRLWRLRGRYQPRGCLQAYLLRTVRTICLDYARAARPWDMLEDGAETATSSPEDISQRRGLADAVTQAVQALPEPQRAVFILSQYEQFSYAEIAATLGCPVGTVASRKHQATETLRRKLALWSDSMTCDTIQGRLTALLDGELPPETASEIERHLVACPECAQAQVELASVREWAADWLIDAPDITERVLEAIAFDDQSLLMDEMNLMDEMKLLRTEMHELRAEVAALRRQLSRPLEAPAWFPQEAPAYSRLENDPWNSIRS